MYKRIDKLPSHVKSFSANGNGRKARIQWQPNQDRLRAGRFAVSRVEPCMQLLNRWLAVSFFMVCGLVGTAAAWETVEGPLKTRWTKEVRPDNVLPEYPRPQMVRKDWTNLNGLWEYAIRPEAEKKPAKWDGEILVPFAVESALSGVKKPVQPDEKLWYRRTFSAKSLAGGKRLLLNFGAVDWKCTVWVNDKQVGEHTGGYDPFTFDITDAVRDGDNELVVAVTDPTDSGYQPHGK